MPLPDETTFLVKKLTNIRVAMLQLQLGLKNRDAIINRLLDEHYELERLQQSK